MTTRRFVISTLWQLPLLGFVLFGLHLFFIRSSDMPLLNDVKLVASMHSFILFLTLLVMLVLSYIHKKTTDKLGFSFMGAALLKMMASILWLYPLFAERTDLTKPYVLNFMTIYFLYLFYEAAKVFNLLNKSDLQKR